MRLLGIFLFLITLGNSLISPMSYAVNHKQKERYDFQKGAQGYHNDPKTGLPVYSGRDEGCNFFDLNTVDRHPGSNRLFDHKSNMSCRASEVISQGHFNLSTPWGVPPTNPVAWGTKGTLYDLKHGISAERDRGSSHAERTNRPLYPEAQPVGGPECFAGYSQEQINSMTSQFRRRK